MARKQYPSDKGRRRQRPHVKVHLSAKSHRKTAGHFDSAEFRGQFLALLMVAAEANAGRPNAGKLHLGPADIAWISGRRRADVARKSVRHLLEVLEYSHELVGEVIVTSIPKFAKKQGFDMRLHTITETPEEQKNREHGVETPEPPFPPSAERISEPSAPRPTDDANESARPKAPSPTERARAVWPRLVAAAARYGATVTWGKAPTKQATKEIAARIRDGLTDDQLESIIHGAMKNWGPANGDWDPVKALKSTAVYRVSKYEEHLEAYQARTQTQSLDDEVAATRARIRAAHAREKREGAQA